MKVYEITQDEYEQKAVAVDDTPGALVIVRQKNGERRLVRVPEVDRVAVFDAWYEAAGRPWRGVKDIEAELRR
jgi:hypothetical protein